MPGYINKKYSKKGGKITIYSSTPSFNTIRKNVKQSKKNVKPKTKSLSENKKVDISRELELVDKILKDLKKTYKGTNFEKGKYMINYLHQKEYMSTGFIPSGNFL